MNIDPTYIPQGYYFTIKEAGKFKGVQRRTILQWVKKGWIPYIKLNNMGYIISAEAIKDFEPPKPGPAKVR